MLRAVRILRAEGVGLGLPWARFLRDGIWELRVRDADGAQRILYSHWRGRTFGLLHGFTKTTRTTPASELELARARRDDWLGRAKRRQQP